MERPAGGVARERIFFANVESLRFLQNAQDSIGDYLAGNVKTLDDGQTVLATGSRAAFVDQMQELLTKMGVERGDGSIKDITNEARLGLIFDIKTQQAGDYGLAPGHGSGCAQRISCKPVHPGEGGQGTAHDP